MNELQQALFVGALAAEAMAPVPVKDLEEFLLKHPDAYGLIASAVRGVGEDMPSALAAMSFQPPEPQPITQQVEPVEEVANEAVQPGPEQGPGPFGL